MTTGMTAMKSKEEIVALLKGSQPGFGLINMSSDPRAISYDDLMEKVHKQSAYAMHGGELYYVNRDGKVSDIALGEDTKRRVLELFVGEEDVLRVLKPIKTDSTQVDVETIKKITGLTGITPNKMLTINAENLSGDDLSEIATLLSKNKQLEEVVFNKCNDELLASSDQIIEIIFKKNFTLKRFSIDFKGDPLTEEKNKNNSKINEFLSRNSKMPSVVEGRNLFYLTVDAVPEYKRKYLNSFIVMHSGDIKYINFKGKVSDIPIEDRSSFLKTLEAIKQDQLAQKKITSSSDLMMLSKFQLDELIPSTGGFNLPSMPNKAQDISEQSTYIKTEEDKEKREDKLRKDQAELERLAKEQSIADEELQQLLNEQRENIRKSKEQKEKYKNSAAAFNGESMQHTGQNHGHSESRYETNTQPDSRFEVLTSKINTLEETLVKISAKLNTLSQNTPSRAVGTSTKINRRPSNAASKDVKPTSGVSEQNIVSSKLIQHEGQSGVVFQNKLASDGHESDKNTEIGQYERGHSDSGSRPVTPDYLPSSSTNQRAHNLIQKQNSANASLKNEGTHVHVKDPQANDFDIRKTMSVLYIQSLVDKSFSGAKSVVRKTTVKPETKSAAMNILESDRNNVHNTVVPDNSALRFSEAELSLTNTFELLYSPRVAQVGKPAVNTNGPDNDLNAGGNTLAQHSRRLSGSIQQSALNTDRTRSNMRSAFIAPDANQSYSDSSVLSDVGFKTGHDTKSGRFRHQTQNTAQSVLEITGATGSRSAAAVNIRRDNKKPDLAVTRRTNHTSSSAIPMNPTKWEKVYANIPELVSENREVKYAFDTLSFNKNNAANFPESKKLNESQLKCLHDPKEGLTVTSPAGLDYSLSVDEDGIPRAVLKEDKIFEDDSDEEKRKRQAVTVMNMIDNVLSHSTIVNIKTSDLYLHTIANKYIEHLNKELSLRIPVSSTDTSSSDPDAIEFFNSLKNGMLAKANLEKAPWYDHALNFRAAEHLDARLRQLEIKANVAVRSADTTGPNATAPNMNHKLGD